MEAKPIKGKLYVPPLVLESKISELEKSLANERLLIDIEQKVFSTVFKNTVLSKASKSDDMFGSTDGGFDFLNSDGVLDDCFDEFDFSAKLPNHSSFVVNSFGLSSMFEKGKSSTKVDETVSVKTKNAKGKNKSQHSQKPITTGKPKKKHSLVSQKSNSKVSNVSDLSKKKLGARHMWYLDSGCSKHMTGQKGMLTNYTEKYCGIVRFGNDQFSPILGYGDMVHDKVTIKKMSYVEGLGYNLFSIGQFCNKGLETDKQVCLVSKASMQQSWLWHRRLSHLNFRYINKLVSGKLVNELPKLKYVKEHMCAACEKGKMKRDPHKPKPEPSTISPLELLHVDLCGPMRTQSLGGKKYVLVIVDDYSRYTWVKFLRSKDETPEVLITFLKTTQVNLQKPVKFLRTDNGTEFKNKTVEEYLESVGI
ncbi:hypothetical protein L6452_34771 [Arctium lappa]|uniref:Uncharacterized protein n=1 Tax=Arctium lappa TaxID=4217 RepID=A0ACB8YJQ3_ARCLA|nr:hypothetical protein L6452_34771 [Arctium lappa]